MTRIEKIEQALQSLNPIALHIDDDSALHAGHASSQDKGHFTVAITSDAFKDLSLIKRHRLVFDAVGDLMETDIHALSIKATTSSEAQK
jgi:BolA protein